MRKVCVILTAVVIAALIVGCGSSPAASESSSSSGKKTTVPNANVPDWINETSPEDAYWGIGSAKLTNSSLAMETAQARATREIARQVSQLVQGLLTDYSREAGLANNPVSIVHIENIGRNLVNANLTGIRINKREQMQDGTWWVRVAVSNSEIKNTVNGIYDNEAARYSEWKKEEALRRLDSMLAATQQPAISIGD